MDRDAFIAVMNEASGMLEQGEATAALARLTTFDDMLLDQPDEQDYGWIVSYRFRAAFAAGDFAQALHIAENGPARFAADIPAGSMATMYSMAVEAATQLGQADSAVGMADKCIAIRRQIGTPNEVLMAAMTACTLLGDIERHDLATPYAVLLVREGEEFEDYRAYGYYALCAAVEHRVGGDVFDILWSGRDWLTGVDNEFAREAREYLDNSPAIQDRLAGALPPGEPPSPLDHPPFGEPLGLGQEPPLGQPGPVDPRSLSGDLPPLARRSLSESEEAFGQPPPLAQRGASEPPPAQQPPLGRRARREREAADQLPPFGSEAPAAQLPEFGFEQPQPPAPSQPLGPGQFPGPGQLPARGQQPPVTPPPPGQQPPADPATLFFELPSLAPESPPYAATLSATQSLPGPSDIPPPPAPSVEPIDYGPAAGAYTAPDPKQPPADQVAGGETADALLAAGRAGLAAAAFRALIDEVAEKGQPDSLIMGKSVLGLLTALIFDDRAAEAHAVWTDETGPTFLGIWALENGQTSVHDAIAYALVEAFLHALGGGDPVAAANSVDALMARCVDFAFAHDPDTVAPILNTWRQHIHEIFDGTPPPPALAALHQAEQRWGHPIPPGPLFWMRPHSWVVDWL
ncbi:hypothetical protein [Nocardia uniformis]|uniref:hypothetical protein n=1 Tax=Nocardia uniformis TaxID=53432 RepID=UPI000834D4B0|nr:hypothetical protein [Nocardia uniformis]